MIYRVMVTHEYIAERFYTGKVFPRTQVTKGLPRGARFFHMYPGDHGEWCMLFEGKPETGEDVEGAIADVRVEYTTMVGDVPLPIPELKEEER